MRNRILLPVTDNSLEPRVSIPLEHNETMHYSSSEDLLFWFLSRSQTKKDSSNLKDACIPARHALLALPLITGIIGQRK